MHGRASICRSPTRRPAPSVSPGASQVDAVDRAQHVGRARRGRRATESAIANCISQAANLEQRVSHRRSPVRRTSAAQPSSWMQAVAAAAADRPQREVAAMQSSRAKRSGGGTGSPGAADQVGGAARDRPSDSRTASSRAPTAAARACRGGAARGTRRRRCRLDHLSGVHHREPLAGLRDDREVVGDEQTPCRARRAGRAAVQDLVLDRHVERRRRLVAQDQLAARTRAPSRSSRAGACRRTARAGTRRAVARDRGCRPAASARAPARGAPADCARGAPSVPRRSGRRRASPGSARSSAPGRSSRCGRRGGGAAAPRGVARSSPSNRMPAAIRRLRQQPQDGEQRDALAAAGLAHHPHRLARSTRNDAPSTACTVPRRQRDLHPQVPHLEEAGVAHRAGAGRPARRRSATGRGR